jgi:hypothetical protein
MFPNNVEFFVREKEAERQAEIERIRLGRLVRHRADAGRRSLARVLYRLGRHLLEWADKLHVQPVSTASPTAEQTVT